MLSSLFHGRKRARDAPSSPPRGAAEHASSAVALRAASTRTPPLQSLRTSATRYFGLRRYSSECTDKDKLLLMNGNSDRLSHIWFQRSREAVKTVLEADHYLVLLVAFALVLPCGYTMTELWRLKLLPFSGPRTPIPHVDCDDYEDDGESDD